MKKSNAPKERFFPEAALEVQRALQLPRESWMQDWPLEVIRGEHLSMLVDYYPSCPNEGQKYIVMEAIIEAIRMTSIEKFREDFSFWNRVRIYLEEDAELHNYHIYNWVRYRTDDYYKQTPLHQIGKDMKRLWKKLQDKEGKD